MSVETGIFRNSGWCHCHMDPGYRENFPDQQKLNFRIDMGIAVISQLPNQGDEICE
jgi:hypothetical protein